MICPKCALEQPDGSLECPRCGIVFARYLAFQEAALQEADGQLYRPAAASLAGAAVVEEPGLDWQALLLEEDREPDPVRFWGRTALYAFLFVWGWRFILSSVASNYVGESFLHLVNLPFHEAGHVIFGFFGDFIRALGGTLGQLLIPAICLGTFLLKTRDPFGASVALWWLAESFMDIGPYIADARSGELLLLGGVTGRDVPGYHDWENVLGDLNLLQYDHALGALAYGFGRLLMLAAFAWGGFLLVRQHRELRASRETRNVQSGNF
jgi:hypothetical protein